MNRYSKSTAYILIFAALVFLSPKKSSATTSWDDLPPPAGAVSPIQVQYLVPGKSITYSLVYGIDYDTRTDTDCGGSTSEEVLDPMVNLNNTQWIAAGGVLNTAVGTTVEITANPFNNNVGNNPLQSGSVNAYVRDGRSTSDPRYDPKVLLSPTASGTFQNGVPNDLDTIWVEHYTQNPHRGDAFHHSYRITNPPWQGPGDYPLAGTTLKEDLIYLGLDYISGGAAPAPDPSFVAWLNAGGTSGEGCWGIDSNNEGSAHTDTSGQCFGGAGPNDNHGFNPNLSPWSSNVPVGTVLKLQQRMKILNNGGTYMRNALYPTGIYFFRVTQDDVYVVKDGVVNPSDAAHI